MSRRSVSLAVFPLAAIFFAVGWFTYELVFYNVTAGIAQRIIVTSMREAFDHRLTMSFSFALMGVIVGIGTLLSGRFSARRRYGSLFLALLSVAVLAVSGWIVVLVRKMAALSEQVGSTPVLPELSLPLSAIRLYEIGLFGSGCVLAAAVILSLFRIGRSREERN